MARCKGRGLWGWRSVVGERVGAGNGSLVVELLKSSSSYCGAKSGHLDAPSKKDFKLDCLYASVVNSTELSSIESFEKYNMSVRVRDYMSELCRESQQVN